MKIAIPLFKDRVAPHFGSSSQILLVEIKGATVLQEARWDVGGHDPLEIARRLKNLGVEKIICGGISRIHKEWLVRNGVCVKDNQRGEAREVIQELLKDKNMLEP